MRVHVHGCVNNSAQVVLGVNILAIHSDLKGSAWQSEAAVMSARCAPYQSLPGLSRR